MPTKARVIQRDIEDPILQNRVNQLRGKVEQVLNYRTLVSRLERTEGVDPRRNIAIECGHPSTEDISLQDYQDLYDRNPIAKKANDLLPNHCWQVRPKVVEDEDPENETEFEQRVSTLGESLNEGSHYKGDQGNPLWDYLYRADKIAGIGHYGAILVGVGGDEGKNLDQPLGESSSRELIYLRVFSEQLATVKEYDRDSGSPRYGMPEVYNLQLDDTNVMQVSTDTSTRPTQAMVEAHWSRVIHVTDELSSNEVFHIPRLRPSFDRYLDLDKLYSSSAEMYYKGAFPGFHFGTHPQLGGDVEVDSSSMKSMVEEWLNGLQRSITTSGFSVDSLSPQVVDPTAQIDAHVEAICMEKDCPKRIFMGSERGELASSQDKGSWNEVVVARRELCLTPRLIAPTIDRFIFLGILPAPTDGYTVQWPEIDTLSPVDKANVALLITQAIVAFLAGDGEMVLPLPLFLTVVLGFTDKEARAIMDTLEEEEVEETLRQKVAQADEQRHTDQQAQLQQQKDQSQGLDPVAGTDKGRGKK